jgi:hypothetical protein
VPQNYSWAQEAQVDWYEAWVDIGDERTEVEVFAIHSMARGAGVSPRLPARHTTVWKRTSTRSATSAAVLARTSALQRPPWRRCKPHDGGTPQGCWHDYSAEAPTIASRPAPYAVSAASRGCTPTRPGRRTLPPRARNLTLSDLWARWGWRCERRARSRIETRPHAG